LKALTAMRDGCHDIQHNDKNRVCELLDQRGHFSQFQLY